MKFLQYADAANSICTLVLPASFGFENRSEFLDILSHSDDTLKTWILDMRDVKRMDSSGLGLLLTLKEHADAREQSIVLRYPNENIRNTLHRSRFDSLFSVELEPDIRQRS